MLTTAPPLRSAPPVTLLTRHETPVGLITAAWSARGLCGVNWHAAHFSTDRPAGDERLPPSSAGFATALETYFRGDFAALDDVCIDQTGWTPFFGRVYRICRSIPAGRTLSYGELAKASGSPQGARAVGQAMATNRMPLVIPCHRVLATGGGLGGYSGHGGLETKRWLLRHEGALREDSTLERMRCAETTTLR